MTTHLSSLTDAELLSEFRVKRDPLVTTPMEEELAARLEDLVDEMNPDAGLIRACKEYDFDAKAINELGDGPTLQMLAALRKAGIEGTEELNKLLSAAATISSLNLSN